MTRKEMQREVLESMVTARDAEIYRLQVKLSEAHRLNCQQGDKVLELLKEREVKDELLYMVKDRRFQAGGAWRASTLKHIEHHLPRGGVHKCHS